MALTRSITNKAVDAKQHALYILSPHSALLHVSSAWQVSEMECITGEWLGKAGYTGVQVSPPHEDIIVKDYPESDVRQEPWCVSIYLYPTAISSDRFPCIMLYGCIKWLQPRLALQACSMSKDYVTLSLKADWESQGHDPLVSDCAPEGVNAGIERACCQQFTGMVNIYLCAAGILERVTCCRWTRYQPVSYQLVSRSGTESEFIDMVQHCRERDVQLYVDVVINHMAGGSLGDPVTVGRAGTPWQYRYITLSDVARHS